jgi:hypothetical protein
VAFSSTMNTLTSICTTSVIFLLFTLYYCVLRNACSLPSHNRELISGLFVMLVLAK